MKSNVYRGASKTPLKKQKIKKQKKTKQYYASIAINTVQVLIIGLTIVFMYELWIYLIKPIVTNPIKNIEIISPSNEADNQEINRLISEAAEGNSVFTIRPNELIENIESLPWVKEVKFSRKYPDSISVKVDFQIPIAKWGENELLSDSNNIYPSNNINDYSYLPTIYTSNINQKTILEQYKLFNFALKPLHRDIISLLYNDNGSSTIVLDNGTRINIGKNQYAERIQNLISVYNKELYNKFDEIEYIDLRYRQGMAIKFKEAIKNTETKI